MANASLEKVCGNWGYGFGPQPTTPTLPEPPDKDVLAAMRDVPLIFASDQLVRGRVDRDGGEPLHFLFSTMMDRRQHAQPSAQWGDSEPAAQWALHRHVLAGRLIESADGRIAPTDALWTWWRAQNDTANGADRADSKADSPKKFPTSERVLKAIKFVNDYRQRITEGKAPDAAQNAILSLHLKKPVEHSEVKNLSRQLRKYRHLLRESADS